jgi:hypothetical protein
MSAVMTQTDSPQDANPAPHHRRSREEVEALAKNFVATPAEEAAPPAKPRTLLVGGVAGAVVLAVVIALIAWPKSEQAARPAAETDRVVAEVEELRLRMEAERERQRKELAAGKEYLERIAAADAALVKDMSAQAELLSQRAAAAPAAPAADGAPTPRDATRAAALAPAKPAPAPATTVAGTQQPVAAAAAAPQPQAAKAAPTAPAETAPQDVAQLDKSQCTIHVSELSKSGKLTYETVKKMKGVRVDAETGNVFTAPVDSGGGRTVVFEVMPTGCARMHRR